MKLLITLFLLLGAVNVSTADEMYLESWLIACRYVKTGCDGAAPPPIAFVEAVKSSAVKSNRTVASMGGYNELTETVYLDRTRPRSVQTEMLIHEYAHHILHVTGVIEIDRNDIKTVCASEKAAYKVSNKWLRLNGLKHRVIQWKRYYVQCR